MCADGQTYPNRNVARDSDLSLVGLVIGHFHACSAADN
jgi:hypothetical protein